MKCQFGISSYRKGLRMITDEKIKNSSELEFAVFCIENVAAKLGGMQNVFIRHLPNRVTF